MSQVITKNFDVDNAVDFIENITLANANVYLVISQTKEWANDASPPEANSSLSSQVEFWRGALGGKKIVGNDLQLVVPRVNWQNNTVYAAYTDKTDPIGTNFYVLTEDYNVYKCLSNNNGAPSTVMPSYTSVDRTATESDGYVWKYMLTLTTSDRQRFLTADWFPVRTLPLDDGSLQWRVQEQAGVGALNVIRVSNAGVGYTNTSNIVVSVVGDGSGCIASASINTTSQTVSSIIVSVPGSGYHFANVTISGGGGSGAQAEAVISPFQGHGKDPVRELGARNLMINIRLQRDENEKLTVQNDFRQLAILQEPLVFGTTNAMSNSVFTQTFGVQVGSGFGDYIVDEYVFQGGSVPTATFSGRVVGWDSPNNTLHLTETTGSITAAPITGFESGITRFTINTENQDVVPYSGNILYLENFTPISRAEDQTESITTVITF